MASLLIQMAGHGGSGKSTLSRRLASEMGGVVVDLDTIKSSLLESGATWEYASKASYGVLYAFVYDALSVESRVVVVDTPSYWPDIHAQLRAAADRHGAHYVFLECDAPAAVRRQRLADRVHRRSQIPTAGAAPADAPTNLTNIDQREIARPESGRKIVLDTSSEIDLASLITEITGASDQR